MPTQPGAPTVLVVDDEPAIVDSLQKIFERESLRVLTRARAARRWSPPARAGLGAAHRPHDAGHVGHRSAARQQEHRARDRDRAHDRLRHRRERGRGDEAGRLRLRHQAAQARARGARRRQGAREALAGPGEPLAARAAGGRAAARAHRAVAGLAAHDGDRHAGGAVAGDGAAARRVGHRQGAAGARDPRQLAARGRPVRAGQLRGAARDDPRGGAVRLREGRLHRAPPSATTAASCRPTAARCSSTRSARSRRTSRSSSCACCRRARSSGSAGGR